MRKNYILPILMVMVASFVFSCNDDENLGLPVTTNVPSAVAIIPPADTAFLEGEAIEIPVRYYGAGVQEDFTVNYTVTGDITDEGVLTFSADDINAGNYTQNIVIDNADNNVIGGDKRVLISLTAASNNVLVGSAASGAETSVELSISEDLKILSLVSDTTRIFENQPISIPISLTNPLDEAATVSYSISGDFGEGDYTLGTSNPLVLPKGTTDTTIEITLNNNNLREDLRSLYVTLESITSENDAEVMLITNTTDINIGRVKGFDVVDEDKQVNFNMELDSMVVNSAGTIRLPVVLSEASEEPFTVQYSITPASNSDYNDVTSVANTGTLHYSAGETSRNIVINFSKAAFEGTVEGVYTVTLESIGGEDEEIIIGEMSDFTIYTNVQDEEGTE